MIHLWKDMLSWWRDERGRIIATERARLRTLEAQPKLKPLVTVVPEPEATDRRWLEIPKTLDGCGIEELEFSARVESRLKQLGIETLGDLCTRSRADLLAVRGLGRKSIDEIVEVLSYYNRSLRDEKCNA